MSDHIKLYIPGPIEVSPSTYEAMMQPMIGHRSKEFQDLYGGIQEDLQSLFDTKRPVFLSTSSAWGIMEGAIRNTVQKKVLNCCAGAFSDKWYDVSLRCGKKAEALKYEWGQPVAPSDIENRLATGEFDVVTLVHNETSTGCMSPLKEIAATVRKFPDVILIVDTVSSFSVVPTPVDAWGIDVLLTGTQKALAMPPGLALFTLSERAIERAKEIDDRGYYFDFIEFQKNQAKDMTPSTPSIALIYALRSKLCDIKEEGIKNRYARHADLNNMVHSWIKDRGFEFLAPEGYRSKSLTCAKNNRDIDLPRLISLLRENHSLTIDGGYGKIKGKTFRISNMGDESRESMQVVLDALDDSIARL